MREHKDKLLVLCILDGLGIGEETQINAVFRANTPNLDKLIATSPTCRLQASGPAVGLPENQPGNSEVGHLTIGAGRVIEQDLPRIHKAFRSNFLAESAELSQFVSKLEETGGAAHILGLISDGGVHSHVDHIASLARYLRQQNIPVFIHVTTDGRDTAPNASTAYISLLKKACPEDVVFATIIGRYFSMDRDKRWERTQIAYDLIKEGTASHHADTAEQAIRDAYDRKETDEFITSTVLADYKGMSSRDGILMTNFRVDRARQIMSAFFIPDETELISKADIKPAAGLAITPLSDRLNEVVPHLFAPADLRNGLGETISKSGLSQLRLAETEKYPHVTFFFNGGIETPFKGESRELVASPKVATYDLQPKMSAQELLQKALSAIRAHTAEVIIINFANPDMVGHTGDLKAAIAAVETIDQCVGELIKAITATNGIMIVTADHGNCDVMWDAEKQIPHTAHTTNLVSCSFVGGDISGLSDGTLADIAPTMLDLLNITKPAEMSGKSLIENKP